MQHAPQAPVLDLATILAQAQAGQAVVITALYMRYGRLVQHYCYVRLASVEAAEDCTQDVFVHILGSIAAFEYRGEASFISWLYTLANRVVIDYIRKHWRVCQVSLVPELGLADDRTNDIAGMICNRLALHEALSQLTAEHQRVLTLKFFGGLSNLEIAAHMRRTEGAVKSLQYRAIQHLQRVLTDAYVDQLAVASCGPRGVFVD
jgi:RNA polymerase sigma-70 factor (ECF subfamily)